MRFSVSAGRFHWVFGIPGISLGRLFSSSTISWSFSNVGAGPCACPAGLYGQPRRGSVPECRGRPLCLPIRIAPVAALKKGGHRELPYAKRKVVSMRQPSRIAHALRRDAVRRKPHPRIQPEKLHPQIGYRRFTPASGGQIPSARRPRRLSSTLPRRGGKVSWEHQRPRRHMVQPRPRGTGAPHISLWPSGSCVPRKKEWGKNQAKRRVCWAVCRFAFLCPPRAGVDTRPAWPGVDSKRLARALRHENVNRVARVAGGGLCGQTQGAAPPRCGKQSPRGCPALRVRLEEGQTQGSAPTRCVA
jgi:hypothetical protein